MRDLEAAYQRIIHWCDRAEDGCLVSRYSTGSHGYAQAWDGATVVLAHRIVWEWHHGPIPKGMTVDHKECRHRKCIEILHLRLITNLENARRNRRRDGTWPVDGRCLRGHDASEWRPKSDTRKKGYCRLCKVEWQYAYKQKQAHLRREE